MTSALPIAAVLLACAALWALPYGQPSRRARRTPHPPSHRRDGVGVGTVRAVADSITVDVESTSGQRFVGRLDACGEPPLPDLQAGVVLLVTFDPSAHERLFLADDMAAVRAEFDAMFLRKGLVTPEKLELIRAGTRSRGIVTAVAATGELVEDHREVELDLMVRRVGGGQFAAHETTLVPASALPGLAPGSLVDTYYRHGDESCVAVCLPPR